MVPASSCCVSVLQCILYKGRISFYNIDVVVTKQFCIFRRNLNILEHFGKLFLYVIVQEWFKVT